MIEWSPTDVLTCLETEPVVDEEETSYRYTVKRQGLLFVLEVWPYSSDVWLGLREDQQSPLVDLRMTGCREIRYLRDGDGEALQFVSFEERSGHVVNFPAGWTLQLTPHIQVRIGHLPAL